jgi:2-polyprenyl-3-methyl-5-hydroxy-6-metoxy-1,4-benzoquinol methylase
METGPDRTEQLARCPVCGGERFIAYRPGTFSGFDLSPEQIKITDSGYGRLWDLSLCRDCRHVFANPCPSPALMNALYAAVEDPLYDEEAEGRSRNFKRILDALERLLPGRGALFDVGAATGILLDLARARGWEPDGIEPSAWAVRFAKDKYGLTIRTGDFETAGLPAGAYRAVTMIDVIEHTPRPAEALRRAFEILAPGGLLCVVTPDLGSAAAAFMGRKWWHFRPGHLSYFTKRSLTRLLEGTGFAIIRRRRYAWTFSAHYLVSRIERLRLLAGEGRLASFLRRIPIKLALGDSFEIYARKGSTE